MRAGWIELIRRSMEATFSCLVRSAGGRLIQLDGVQAGVNPKVPERSVFNSVIYSDPAALAAAHEEVAAAYAEHGCSWTVWVPEDDAATATVLQQAGHERDAAPRAMGFEIGDYPEPDLSGIDWTDGGDLEQAYSLNDAAYGYEPGTWRRGSGDDPQGLITYLARLDGAPASTVAARYSDGDCSIWNVATSPRARGKGLATALMRRAVWDAAQAGCTTSTLQGTAMGTPVYRRVGYEDFGALEMWELRPAEQAAQAHPGAHAPPPQ